MTYWRVYVEHNHRMLLSIQCAPLEVAMKALGATLLALPSVEPHDLIRIDVSPV